jgi:hypothetical protein
MAATKRRAFEVTGQVIDRKTRRGFASLRVEAWENDLIANSITDARGRFHLSLKGGKQPGLFFKLFRLDQLLKSTSDAVIWTTQAGRPDITIEIEMPAPIPASARRTAPLAVTGQAVHAANGYPLAGLRVGAWFVPPPTKHGGHDGGSGNRHDTLLGEGIADSSGRFAIRFRDAWPARAKLCRLREDPEASFVLKIEGLRGTPLFVSNPLTVASVFPVTLRVPLAAKPILAAAWKGLGARLEKARVAQLHELVRQLVAVPAAQSLFGDWDLETRHSVAARLEHAFLDPDGVLQKFGPLPTLRELHAPEALEQYQKRIARRLRNPRVQQTFITMSGKVASFSDLLEVDWVMDVEELKKGKPGKAVNKFQNAYELPSAGALAQPSIEISLPSKLSGYRDYLRTIYADAPKSADYAKRRDQLENRFHQDFETLSITERPANQILAPIVKKILTAPKGSGYGFGLSAASIDAQGSRTHREYLDYLIGLSKLSGRELGLRYRLNFERHDSVLSSRVQENIGTLQGFYRDSFQCEEEPYQIIPDKLVGKAPFFLQYDEWLAQTGPFYGENFYPITATFASGMDSDLKKQIHDVEDEDIKWFAAIGDIEDLLNAATKARDEGQFKTASEKYQQADDLALMTLRKIFQKKADDPVYASYVINAFQARLQELKALPMNSAGDLEAFVEQLRPAEYIKPVNATNFNPFGQWRDEQRERAQLSVLHLCVYVLPTCLGDLALAMGDYPRAIQQYERTTRFLLARAETADSEGYDPYADGGTYEVPETIPVVEKAFQGGALYREGQLPYTTPRFTKFDDVQVFIGFGLDLIADIAVEIVKPMTHWMEKKFFKLRHGNAMLEWADALYRSDEPGNIARAREIYKAVLWLFGETPPICPTWPSRFRPAPDGLPSFGHHLENPAITAQKARARRGLLQIDADLNYYGFSNDMVPVLRYRPLKDAADRFAATAKSAQQDFLVYMEKIEEALRDSLVTGNMLKKAMLQGQIAVEQAKIAQFTVTLAQRQVDQVNATIKAKEDEIADHDGLGEQFVDWVGGFVGVVKDLPSSATGFVSTNAPSAAGLTEAGEAGSAGLGAAGAMAGYGIFVYAGITSLVNMGEAQNSRAAELKTLKEDTLPLAMAQLKAKQREVTIANLQQQIAQADADLAQALMKFQATRFLNIEFWSKLAAVAKRVMRRYLELGARYGWLAERALAYEQDRLIRVVRFDYFPMKLQGVTGADLLELDLGELDASRLDGIKQTVPVKRTYSLAFDFPLQFGQLRKTGRCSFMTPEEPFRLAYPGTYGYRTRAVTISALSVPVAGAPRGLLTNQGVSLVSRADGTNHVSLRNAEALPLSEFRLSADMAVYELPDEALLNFEGSGVETLWSLEFSNAANPYGLDHLADVLITFDMRAHFSPELYKKHIGTMPTTARRFLFFAASKFLPDGLVQLQGDASPATLEFDVPSLGLPQKEANRKVKNIAIILAADKPLTLTATLSSAAPAENIAIAIEDSVALSNAPPLTDAQSSAPPSPLNALMDLDADQIFVLTIDKAANAGVDFSKITDVIFGLEYTADLSG